MSNRMVTRGGKMVTRDGKMVVRDLSLIPEPDPEPTPPTVVDDDPANAYAAFGETLVGEATSEMLGLQTPVYETEITGDLDELPDD